MKKGPSLVEVIDNLNITNPWFDPWRRIRGPQALKDEVEDVIEFATSLLENGQASCAEEASRNRAKTALTLLSFWGPYVVGSGSFPLYWWGRFGASFSSPFSDTLANEAHLRNQGGESRIMQLTYEIAAKWGQNREGGVVFDWVKSAVRARLEMLVTPHVPWRSPVKKDPGREEGYVVKDRVLVTLNLSVGVNPDALHLQSEMSLRQLLENHATSLGVRGRVITQPGQQVVEGDVSFTIRRSPILI